MKLGGVILGAGMVLDIAPGDYLYGEGSVLLTLHHVVGTRRDFDEDWVILQGTEKRPLSGPWWPRRVQVRVSALSRSLALTGSL